MIGLWMKFKGYVALLGLIIVALLTAYVKGRRGGTAAAQAEATKASQRIQRKWDQIEGKTPDVGQALKNLRKRSLDP